VIFIFASPPSVIDVHPKEPPGDPTLNLSSLMNRAQSALARPDPSLLYAPHPPYFAPYTEFSVFGLAWSPRTLVSLRLSERKMVFLPRLTI